MWYGKEAILREITLKLKEKALIEQIEQVEFNLKAKGLKGIEGVSE